MAISSILGGGGGNLAGIRNLQNQNSEMNEGAQIGAQMQAENRKTGAQINQIKQETNTKVAEMFRESNLNRAKSASKLHNKWVQQIMA